MEEPSPAEKDDDGEESEDAALAKVEGAAESESEEQGEMDAWAEKLADAPVVQYDANYSEAFAQPPKLEVIEEHEIWETRAKEEEEPVAAAAPAVVTVPACPLAAQLVASYTSPVLFSVDGEGSESEFVLNVGEPADFLDEAPMSDSASLQKQSLTEPTRINSVLRQVGSMTRRLFGSRTVTPSDSLASLEFGVSASAIAGPSHFNSAALFPSASTHRFFRRTERGNQSSRNSVSSDTSAFHVPQAAIGRRGQRKRAPAAPAADPGSRSRRFLVKGTAGFFAAKGTSAISLRPPEPLSDLPFPCAECPHCRKFLKMGDVPIPIFKASGLTCPCRICTILEENEPGAHSMLEEQSGIRAKISASGIPHAHTVGQVLASGDFGVFCSACNNNVAHAHPKHNTAVSGYVSPDGRESRVSSVGGSLHLAPHSVPTMPSVVLAPGGTAQTSRATSAESLFRGRGSACQISQQVSLASLGTMGPICRICHAPGDKDEPVISPCRCAGTLKYLHTSCLIHWLQISCRKLRKPPQCELCGYRYRRHKVLRLDKATWPRVSRRDRVFHVLFLSAVLAMVSSAIVTLVCFRQEPLGMSASALGPGSKQATELNGREILTLVCGVSFFCAFFLAMYAQVKASTTILKLLRKAWLMNHEWYVDEYRPDKDPEYAKRQRLRRAALAAKLARDAQPPSRESSSVSERSMSLDADAHSGIVVLGEEAVSRREEDEKDSLISPRSERAPSPPQSA